MRLARLACSLLASLAGLLYTCAAERREVFSCGQLRDALEDGSVDHIVAMQAGSFNCTADSVASERPVGLIEREVLLEGEGPGLVYVDYNRFKGLHVLVADGGKLSVRNMWLDHCLGRGEMPICIGNVLEGGELLISDSRLSDIACVNARRSPAIGELEKRVGHTGDVDVIIRLTMRSNRSANKLDARTLLFKDTGWLDGAVPNSRWRLSNTTLTCTGNTTTHVLPEDFEDVQVLHLSPLLLGTGGLALLALAGGLLWCGRTRARNAQPPECKIAEARGFVLEAPLGKGHFGRVYRGRKKSGGQIVAIKVIELLPSQRRQVLAAYRECQLLSSLQHECILRVFTFYTAKVQRRHQVVEPVADHSGYVELTYQTPLEGTGSATGSIRAAAHLGPSRLHDSSSSSQGLASGKPSSGGESGTTTHHQSSGSGSGSAAFATALSEDKLDGVLSIQVQLVTQYCDLGTLEQAVKSRMFVDAQTGKPKMRHILLTALEIARGLEYLQQPQRRMVHRDLSANNVLLTTSAVDDRGFRAVLSDFGLSTVLSAEQTHKTSQVKGTISYMSPELFIRDDVSPALDVYSLGIILHLMYCGKDPYAGQTPAMTILAKVRTGARLPPLDSCPNFYQQLVWDCTHADRRSRPTAAALVQRLETHLLDLQR